MTRLCVFTLFLTSALAQVPARPVINGVITASAYGGFAAGAPGSVIEIHGANLAATARGRDGRLRQSNGPGESWRKADLVRNRFRTRPRRHQYRQDRSTSDDVECEARDCDRQFKHQRRLCGTGSWTSRAISIQYRAARQSA